MIVIPYSNKTHINYARALLELRGMDFSFLEELPEHGLIALEQGMPVALGFIRRVEGSYAMVDSYVTNPNYSSETRHKALDRITKKLLSWCKANHISKVLSFSSDGGIISRAINNGFQKHMFFSVLFQSLK